jgi:hypothetical protein
MKNLSRKILRHLKHLTGTNQELGTINRSERL